MNPGTASKLAADLAESDLDPAARLVLLSLILATGKDDAAHMSAKRLADRCGLSVGHTRRQLAALIQTNHISVETVPGRASRYRIEIPEGVRAGAQGGARPRAGGYAPARTVSSNPPRNLSAPSSATDPKGSPPPAFEPDDGAGVVDGLRRNALVTEIRNALRGGLRDAV